ncbi:MAG: hypothetical protein WAX12_09800 [Candidatus Microthrix subdominans]
MLLDHEAVQDEDRSIADSIVVFTCAFFALLVLSFNYAGLSGRPSDGAAAGIAAHEQFLFGAVFGLASLLTIVRTPLRAWVSDPEGAC